MTKVEGRFLLRRKRFNPRKWFYAGTAPCEFPLETSFNHSLYSNQIYICLNPRIRSARHQALYRMNVKVLSTTTSLPPRLCTFHGSTYIISNLSTASSSLNHPDNCALIFWQVVTSFIIIFKLCYNFI